MRVLKQEYEIRCESDAEAKSVIESFKKEAEDKGNTLISSSTTYKEKKSKGEVIDAAFVVKVKICLGTIWDFE
jgi:hypothetical protein